MVDHEAAAGHAELLLKVRGQAVAAMDNVNLSRAYLALRAEVEQLRSHLRTVADFMEQDGTRHVLDAIRKVIEFREPWGLHDCPRKEADDESTFARRTRR